MSQNLVTECSHQAADEPICLPNSKKGIFVKTFGCQMNEYDSEKMLSLLSATHHPVVKPEEAEVMIINTCSVREKAENKLYALLGIFRELKKKRPEIVIGVSGCAAQQEGERIIKRNRAVDFVVGTHNLSLVPSLVRAVRSGCGPQVAVDFRDEWEELPDDIEGKLSPSAFKGVNNPIRALVAIQRGCNKNCAFCVVPNTRGPEVSRLPEEIEREVRIKIRLGAKEVLLLGQTVNSYGRDLPSRYSFEKLIRRLSQIEGLKRIRFTSPHPAEVRPEFIKLYGEIAQLCPHIHLPLQSGSDRILRLMNRNYRVKRYLEIVDQLKEHSSEIAISSDFIVGFPTETEEDFQKTLEMINRVGYNSSYSFKYSKRPNTSAAINFDADVEVPKTVAQERLLRLQNLQEKISFVLNQKMRGTLVEVLVEVPSHGVSSIMRGRTPQNVLVELFEGGVGVQPGEVVRARIEEAGSYGLKGRVM